MLNAKAQQWRTPKSTQLRRGEAVRRGEAEEEGKGRKKRQRVGKFIGSHHMLLSVIIYYFFGLTCWFISIFSPPLLLLTPFALLLVSVAIAVFFAWHVTLEKGLRIIPCSIFVPLTELKCYCLSLDLLVNWWYTHFPCLLGKSSFVFFWMPSWLIPSCRWVESFILLSAAWLTCFSKYSWYHSNDCQLGGASENKCILINNKSVYSFNSLITKKSTLISLQILKLNESVTIAP